MAIQMVDKRWCPCVDGYRKDFICDTDTDAAYLPNCCAGSSALVPSSGNIYVVNASGQWVEFGAEG